MSSPNLRPGDRVRLLDGKSAGIIGTVLNVLSKNTVSVVLNRTRVTYATPDSLRFVRAGVPPALTDVWLGEREEGKP